MLNPEFPVVEHQYQMTREWSVFLPDKFNRRIDDGALVIWRPGFTIWIIVWGNDNRQSQEQRVNEIKADISPDAFDLLEEKNAGLLFLSYRLNEPSDDKRSAAYYCFCVGTSGHVQMAIYLRVSGNS